MTDGVSLAPGSSGADLFAATHIHRLLQALLGLPTPRYRHHRLLADASGKRFAKRDRSLTLRALREAGRSAEEVRAMAVSERPSLTLPLEGGGVTTRERCGRG